MRLYLAAGQWVGTQAEARALERDFKTVEVPTDKPGLIQFLNNTRQALLARARQPLSIEEENKIMEELPWQEKQTCTPAVAPGDIDKARARRDDQEYIINVEEAIAAASYPRALRYAEHAHCRLMEFARAAKP